MYIFYMYVCVCLFLSIFSLYVVYMCRFARVWYQWGSSCFSININGPFTATCWCDRTKNSHTQWCLLWMLLCLLRFQNFITKTDFVCGTTLLFFFQKFDWVWASFCLFACLFVCFIDSSPRSLLPSHAWLQFRLAVFVCAFALPIICEVFWGLLTSLFVCVCVCARVVLSFFPLLCLFHTQ